MEILLSDLTTEEFIRGVKIFVLKHKEIYPNTNVIAYIREYALVDPENNSAEEAWGEVVREKNRVFIYSNRVLLDELAEQTVKIMGWRNLCLSQNEEADRAHFFRIYKSLFEKKKNKSVIGNF